MQTSVKLDHTVLAVEQEHEVHAMLEIAAPAGPGRRRRPLRLALVIDRSGSMAGQKLGRQACARWLVDRLLPEDSLALVAYDESVLLSGLEPVSRPTQAAAIASSTRAGRRTSPAGG